MINLANKTYTTGEFAKEFGIKKDTLFYYDKIGLFKPAGIHENGYRYYSLEQFDTFWAIQALRHANVPIQTLIQFFNKPSLPALQDLTYEQLQVVTVEIEQLMQTKVYLEQVTQIANEMATAQFHVLTYKEFEEAPVKYSRQTIDYHELMDLSTQKYEEFIEEMGIKGCASMGVVLSHHKDNRPLSSSVFYRCQQSEQAIPAGVYAVYYYKGLYKDFYPLHQQLLNDIERDGYVVDGPLFEEYMLHSLVSSKENDYVTKFFIKVKKVKFS